MRDRIVIVTGANGGLGIAVTNRFLQASDTVIGTSQNIRQDAFASPNFLAVTVDFADSKSVQQLANTVIQKFGRIDVLVNLIGGFAGGTPIHETDESTWSRMLDLNLNAAFNAIRAVLPAMRKAGRGRFIAVGSKTAEQPIPNLGAYVISKTALVTLVKTVALENLDLDITANVVLPGTMDTPANRAAMPKVDPKSWVQTSEVAEAIFWLAGDSASHVTGAAIPVG